MVAPGLRFRNDQLNRSQDAALAELNRLGRIPLVRGQLAVTSLLASGITHIRTEDSVVVYDGAGGDALLLPKANAQGTGVSILAIVVNRGLGSPVVYADAGDTIDDMTFSTVAPGQVGVFISDGVSEWTLLGARDSRSSMEIADDFLGVADGFQGGMVSQVTGAGAIVEDSIGDRGHPGVIELNTGTTSTGQAGVRTNGMSAFRLGGDRFRFASWVYLPDLSTSGERFTFRSGFGDLLTGEVTDGVFFRYTDNVAGGAFQAVTRNNSTETAITGPGVAEDTWYRLEIDVNGTGTSASFAINGTQIGVITTNIPTAVGRELGVIAANMIKSVGTTARRVLVDRVEFSCNFGAVR